MPSSAILGVLMRFALLDVAYIASVVAATGDSPINDPIAFFLSQGVLGAMCVVMYRELKSEQRKRDAQNEKMLGEIIPLIVRAVEVIERVGDIEDTRPAPRRRT